MFNPFIWIMSLGHLVVDLAQGVLPIITPLLAERLDLNFFQIGLVALVFTFSSAIIQPVFGVLSDSYNMSWLMPLGLILSGLGLALTGVVPSYGLLLAVVFLSGIGVAGYHPEGSKLTHLVSNRDNAGASMSIFSVGGNLGYGLGPVLAVFLLSFKGIATIYGVVIPGLLSSLLFLYLMPKFNVIMKRMPHAGSKDPAESETLVGSEAPAESEKPAAGKNRCGKGGRKITLLFLLLYIMVRSWIHAGLVYFMPFYFPEFKGIDNHEYLISILLIAGAVGTLLGGPFADRFGGRKGLLVSMIISMVTIYPFIYLTNSFLSIFAFVIGAALISTFSTTVVLGQKLMPDNVGLASGLMLGFAVGMGSVGVTILGAIADTLGLSMVMKVICSLPLAGIVLALALPDDKFALRQAEVPKK